MDLVTSVVASRTMACRRQHAPWTSALAGGIFRAGLWLGGLGWLGAESALVTPAFASYVETPEGHVQIPLKPPSTTFTELYPTLQCTPAGWVSRKLEIKLTSTCIGGRRRPTMIIIISCLRPRHSSLYHTNLSRPHFDQAPCTATRADWGCRGWSRG